MRAIGDMGDWCGACRRQSCTCTMSAKEAWEYIAGELPPGGGACVDGVAWGGGWYRTPQRAWERFATHTSITRRRHAKDIAPRRVREVAVAVWADDLDRVDISLRGDTAMVVVMVWGPWGKKAGSGRERQSVMQSHGDGPDICTAAWACMLAMTEALPEAERAELLGVSVELLREALEVAR